MDTENTNFHHDAGRGRPFSTIVEQRDSQSLQNPPLKSLALPFRRTAWHATKTLFGDCADLAAYLTARRDLRVHVRVRSPGTDGSDDRGKITSLELLRRLRPGDDVGRRDHSRHGALLRALRSKTRRIRTSRCLAQKNNHAAGYA